MADLTISQALRKIRDVKGRLAKHQANAASSVRYSENDLPAYKFFDSIQESTDLLDQLLNLQAAVAAANVNTRFPWKGTDVSVAWAVKRLEALKGLIKWYGELVVLAHASVATERLDFAEVDGRTQRVRVPEIQKCDLPEATRATVIQTYQDEFNELNDMVETINHRTSI